MEIYVKLILSFNVSDMDFMNQTLLKNIKNSISETVPKKKIGVAFSGGVDSTLVSVSYTHLTLPTTPYV